MKIDNLRTYKQILISFNYNLSDIEFKKQVLRYMVYFKVELKHTSIISNQNELLERINSIEKILEENPIKHDKACLDDYNYMSDCPLPIENEANLNMLEDKILDNAEFKNNLVNTSILNILNC